MHTHTGAQLKRHDDAIAKLSQAQSTIESRLANVAKLEKMFGLDGDGDGTDLSALTGPGPAHALERDERSWALFEERVFRRDNAAVQSRADQLSGAATTAQEQLRDLSARADAVAADEEGDKGARLEELVAVWSAFESGVARAVADTRATYADLVYWLGKLGAAADALDGDDTGAAGGGSGKDSTSEWAQALRERSGERRALLETSTAKVQGAAHDAAPVLEETEAVRSRLLRLLATFTDPAAAAIYNETTILMRPPGAEGKVGGDGAAQGVGTEGEGGGVNLRALDFGGGRSNLNITTQQRVIVNEGARVVIEEAARKYLAAHATEELLPQVLEQVDAKVAAESADANQRIGLAFNDPAAFSDKYGVLISAKPAFKRRGESPAVTPRPASPGGDGVATIPAPATTVASLMEADGHIELNEDNFDVVAQHVSHLSGDSVPRLRQDLTKLQKKVAILGEAVDKAGGDVTRLADTLEPGMEALTRDTRKLERQLGELAAGRVPSTSPGPEVEDEAVSNVAAKLSMQAAQIEGLFDSLAHMLGEDPVVGPDGIKRVRGKPLGRRDSMDTTAFKKELEGTAASLSALLQKQAEAEAAVEAKLKLKANVADVASVHSVLQKKADQDWLHEQLSDKLDRRAIDKLLDEYMASLDSRFDRVSVGMRDERQAEVDELRRKFKVQLRAAIQKALADAGVAGYGASKTESRFGRVKLEFCAGCDRPVDTFTNVPVPTAVHGRLPNHAEAPTAEDFVYRGGGFRVPSRQQRAIHNEMGLEVFSAGTSGSARPKSASASRSRRGRLTGSASASSLRDHRDGGSGHSSGGDPGQGPPPATPMQSRPRSGVDEHGRPYTAPAGGKPSAGRRRGGGGADDHSAALAQSGSGHLYT